MQTVSGGLDASWIYSFYRTLTLSLALFPVCRAVLVNRTIDSTYGDPLTGFVPQYHSPEHAWADQTCTGCWIQPDPKLIFDGTWSAVTYYPRLQNVNFTLEFTGVAIYVFFILANAESHGWVTNTHCNFTLDGRHVGSFSHDPGMSTYDLEYNVTVFSMTGLTNTSHQLVVLVNDYPNPTFLDFDWAIYTVDLIGSPSTSNTTQNPSTSASSLATHRDVSPSQRTSIIVGCVLGVVAVAAIAIIVLFHIRRLRRSRQLHNGMTPGGILDIDDFPGASPRVESQYRTPSDLNNDYSESTQGALIEYGRPHPILGSAGEVPSMRQMGNSKRLGPAQHETGQLTAAQGDQPAGDRSPTHARSQQEIASLRNQVQELRNRIEYMQDPRQSDRALDLSDEQPPAYE